MIIVPRMSFRLSRLVVPMMGAVTPSLESTQEIATCAMLMPRFFATSSTLDEQYYELYGRWDKTDAHLLTIASVLPFL